MARAPDPRIDEAKAMYLKGVKLVEIAHRLDLPEGTVRRWKSTHKWESERSDRKSERSKRKRGAQPGNKNSSGGPPGNKKAVTTGEFETLLFDCLEPEERQLAAAVPPDKEQLLLQEQLPQGSLRLSFLIAWNRKSGSWLQLSRRIKSSCSSRRSGC